MPVLPDDGSRIVAPGFRTPSRSASSTILSAMRSLDDPPGFWPSSFAQIRTSGFGDSRCTPTSGVSPMRPRTSSYLTGSTRSRAAGDRGQDREHVAVGHLRVETLEVADVVVVLVDVDELVEAAAVVQKVAPQARVAIYEG